jgi:hypothetical protein
VLRRMFRPKREEVAGGWRRLHNEELHKLYASLNVITVIKSGKMRKTRSTQGSDEKLQYFACNT